MNLYFFSSPRLALRAKCHVPLAWVIKRLFPFRGDHPILFKLFVELQEKNEKYISGKLS